VNLQELTDRYGFPAIIDIPGHIHDPHQDRMVFNGYLTRIVLAKLPNGNWLFKNPKTGQEYESIGGGVAPLKDLVYKGKI
jgi:hypothetical protein